MPINNHMYTGTIQAHKTDRKHLEGMGITLGAYDPVGEEFTNCLVPIQAIVRLDKYWGGEYTWNLQFVEGSDK